LIGWIDDITLKEFLYLLHRRIERGGRSCRRQVIGKVDYETFCQADSVMEMRARINGTGDDE
jgi:hypothetical protein